jgi:squalene-hopene/tetraprenyl-beta-curcumene cyclase
MRPTLLALAAGLAFSAPALALDPEPSPDTVKAVQEGQRKGDQVGRSTLDVSVRAHAEEMADKAASFLRSRQDKASGGWSIPAAAKEGQPAQPHLPGVSALVLSGLLLDPRADAADPAIAAGLRYLLRFQQPDGGIYDRMLPSYNTSLAVSALSRARTPEAKAAVEKAVKFLRSLQFGEDAAPEPIGGEKPQKVGKDHPFYGGVGYGRSGRPDASNLNMFMQALQDAGVSPQDPAVQRALVFLQRVQMDERVNDMPFAKGSRQGGFVYSTAENADSVDKRAGQSQAGTVEETLSDGTRASRLRAYGSMTYAGFKSYVYAELPRDDQRVKAALGWIQRNYTLDENPGVGTDGLYYYYLVFARALRAWGEPTVRTLTETGAPAEARDWRADLIEKLASLQNPDGSFKSVDDRWMENNPDLITAYALVALRQALAD